SSSSTLDPSLYRGAPPRDERALRLGFLGLDWLSRAARGGWPGGRWGIVSPPVCGRLPRRSLPSPSPGGSLLAFCSRGLGADVHLDLFALGGNHGRTAVHFCMAAPAARARMRTAAI